MIPSSFCLTGSCPSRICLRSCQRRRRSSRGTAASPERRQRRRGRPAPPHRPPTRTARSRHRQRRLRLSHYHCQKWHRRHRELLSVLLSALHIIHRLVFNVVGMHHTIVASVIIMNVFLFACRHHILSPPLFLLCHIHAYDKRRRQEPNGHPHCHWHPMSRAVLQGLICS